MLKAIRYRVQNFRNIDDSGWISLERVTAFVGRNESGKTALLKALHKFNPATKEPYNPQREFPRDRYTREFKKGADWPVCSVAFTLDGPLKDQIAAILGGSAPKAVVCTRFYDGSLKIEYDPEIQQAVLSPGPVTDALTTLAGAARRLPAPAPDKEEATQKIRTDLATWATAAHEIINAITDLRNEDGRNLLANIRKE
jgi:hypothetical protein